MPRAMTLNFTSKDASLRKMKKLVVSPSMVELSARITSFPTRLYALYKALYLKVGRADAFHGRDDTAEHVVQSVELLGSFYRHHIADVLYHAEGGCIALGIGADVARFGIGYVVAHLAVFHLAFQLQDGIAEVLYHGMVLTEQVEHQAHGSLTAYTGQFGKFSYRFFEELGWIGLIHIPILR